MGSTDLGSSGKQRGAVCSPHAATLAPRAVGAEPGGWDEAGPRARVPFLGFRSTTTDTSAGNGRRSRDEEGAGGWPPQRRAACCHGAGPEPERWAQGPQETPGRGQWWG